MAIQNKSNEFWVNKTLKDTCVGLFQKKIKQMGD